MPIIIRLKCALRSRGRLPKVLRESLPNGADQKNDDGEDGQPSSTSVLLMAASTISVAEVPATSYPMPAQHCRDTVWQCLLNHLGGRVNRRSPSGGYQEAMRFTSIEYPAGYPPSYFAKQP
jgi:hypothetical protein